MPYTVVLDFETRSACDLRACGAWIYSKHPTTGIICLSWLVQHPDGRRTAKRRWEPLRLGTGLPRELVRLAGHQDVIFEAFNVSFEFSIWSNLMVPRFGAPAVPRHRWQDTQAKALHRGLPSKLEAAAKVSGVGEKDMEGNKLLHRYCKPRKARKAEKLEFPDWENMLFWHEDDAGLARLGEYCDQDVDVEARLDDYVGPLPDDEHEVWLLDQKMNQTGLLIDIPAVHAAKSIMAQYADSLDAEVDVLTGGEVTTCGQRDKILETIKKWCGRAPKDLTAETLTKFLGNKAFREKFPEAHRLLQLRQSGSKSSTAKLNAMLNHADPDDHRARYQLQYQGASSTGRWAGRGIQPQNMPGNSSGHDEETLISAIKSGDLDKVRELGDPAEIISSALRPMIRAADGHEIVAGDFSAVEARVVLAFAEQWDKVNLLKCGHDAYCDMASTIFGYPVIGKKEHPVERQVGKNAVLGLGFQCGAGTFQEKFCTDRHLEFCETVVRKYRNDWAPNVPSLWEGLNAAAIGAVAHPGRSFSYGPIEFVMEGDWLTARLPSGRRLYYHGAHTTLRSMPWDAEDKRLAVSYFAWKYGAWRRVDAYGGILTENVVQAAARDMMANAMLAAEREGYNPILTVHDEVVTEPREGVLTVEQFENLMVDCQPQWVRECGIPVAVEGWKGHRYKK